MADILKDSVQKIERHIDKYTAAVENGKKLEEEPDLDVGAIEEYLKSLQERLQEAADRL